LNKADWNPAAYDEIADPMFEWGMASLATLSVKGNERVLDAGCGSGRLTEELLGLLPEGSVVALDFSPKMMEQARQRLSKYGDRAEFVEASLQDFELSDPVDGVFSNAVFHWVPDHSEMFKSLHRALKPGGWLVAEFGGVGNLERTLRRGQEVAQLEPFCHHLKSFDAGPHFEAAAATRERLEAAGFVVHETELYNRRPLFEFKERYEAFLTTVILRQPIAALPEELREAFVQEISRRTLQEEGSYSFDYVRLMIRATA
jgi:trans-aconitate 2-methyltransferase